MSWKFIAVVLILIVFNAVYATTSSSKAAEGQSPDQVCDALHKNMTNLLNRTKYCLSKTVLRDCCDSLIVGGVHKTGIYWILDDSTKGLCENGWLWMLRNRNKAERNIKFERRKLKKYETGFGDFNGDFFLGLKTLHRLTQNATMQLRVDLRNSSGNFFAIYDDFAVQDKKNYYKLRIGNYSSGTLRDLFSKHNNGQFATIDYNWNPYISNPVGGWWFIPGYGETNFVPYSVIGPFWRDSSREFAEDHRYDHAEIKIRRRRYPCIPRQSTN